VAIHAAESRQLEVEVDLDLDALERDLARLEGQSWCLHVEPVEGEVRTYLLRSRIAPSQWSAPPVVAVKGQPTTRGSRVRVQLLWESSPPRERHPLASQAMAMCGGGGLLMAVAGGLVWTAFAIAGLNLEIGALVGVVFTGFVSICALVPFLVFEAVRANRLVSASMRRYGPETWRALGEVLMPHVLGDCGDNPFRDEGRGGGGSWRGV
jgi:hypothetical protein